MTRYAIVTEHNTVVHVGPATTFATKYDAFLMLLAMPLPESLDYRIVPVDGDFPAIPLPTQPRLPA